MTEMPPWCDETGCAQSATARVGWSDVALRLAVPWERVTVAGESWFVCERHLRTGYPHLHVKEIL